LSDLPNEAAFADSALTILHVSFAAMHIDGLNGDPEALAIAQRYIDDELSIGRA
jgi:hypothetical protein